MVNCNPSVNSVYNLQRFQGFLRQKKNVSVQRVLVLNLVEISEDFLIFIDSKITETRFTSFQPQFFALNKHFVSSICATCAHTHFKIMCSSFIQL